MTARIPDLQLLAPADLLKAAERILAAPTYNVQRVSMDEVFTFAIATTQFAEVCGLAARQLAGQAAPADLAQLHTHLVGLGFIAPGFTLPTPQLTQEKDHG